jgi:hypothetical protein
MRVPSVPTAVAVAVLSFAGSLTLLAGLDAGVVVLPPYLDGTLLRAAPIFLTATVMVCAYNGARFRTNWVLVVGPCLAYTLSVFVPAFGPLAGGAVGVLSGVAVAGFVAGAGHATGRGYRELVDDAVAGEEKGGRASDDATR